MIEFDGIIDEEFEEVINAILETEGIKYISLSSPGGLVSTALLLGKKLREKDIVTYVRSGEECLSACALLFISGSERVMGFHDSQVNRAFVGIHSPFFLENKNKKFLKNEDIPEICSFAREMLPEKGSRKFCLESFAVKNIAKFDYLGASRVGIATTSESEIVNIISKELEDRGLTDKELELVLCERASMWLKVNGANHDIYTQYSEKCHYKPLPKYNGVLKHIASKLGPKWEI